MKKRSTEGVPPQRSAAESDLASVDWEQLYRRLLLAAHRIWGLGMAEGSATAVIARAISPKDLAQKVIEDFLQGKLPWQPERGSLLRFLERVLRNDYLDLVTSKEARTTVRAELLKKGDEDKGDGKTEVDFFDYYQVKKSETLKEHQMLIDEPPSAEERLLGKEKLEGLRQLVRADAELEEVIVAIIERDLLKPADIARYLGTTRQDIYNRFKRLRRCLGCLLAEKRQEAKLNLKIRHS